MNKLREYRDEWDLLQEVYGSDMSPEVRLRGNRCLAKIKAID